jgi:t-SNARE complex subunit (syntaxin)
MIDRLRDLYKYAEGTQHLQTRESNVDEEAAVANDTEFMTDFFRQVERIQMSIRKIESDTHVLQENFNERLVKINPADRRRLGQESEKLVTEINRTSRDVKNKLEEIAKNDPNITVQQAQALAAEERIKKNVHVTLVQDFIRAMEKYQQVQAQFKHKHEENVTRQVLTVNPSATSEEVAYVIQSGEAEQIFANSVQRDQSAQVALNYIRDRHQDIMQIEKSLQELQQLFVDMAMLVTEQGEMIDSVENNIENAISYVVQGKGQLKKANKWATRNRKCMIAIIVLSVVALAVVAIILAVNFTVGFGGSTSPTPSPAPGASGAIQLDVPILKNLLQ